VQSADWQLSAPDCLSSSTAPVVPRRSSLLQMYSQACPALIRNRAIGTRFHSRMTGLLHRQPFLVRQTICFISFAGLPPLGHQNCSFFVQQLLHLESSTVYTIKIDLIKRTAYILSGAPARGIQICETIDGKEHIHSRNGKEVEQCRQHARKLKIILSSARSSSKYSKIPLVGEEWQQL